MTADALDLHSIPQVIQRMLRSGLTKSKSIIEGQRTAQSISADRENPEPFCSQAFILPGQISHTRFTPLFSRFVYSHIYVGIPISSDGFNDGLVTLDDRPCWRRKWFHVAASDHLERTAEKVNLRTKLHRYIESEGLDPALFPYCYLVTTPKFLATPRFNPVSIWYLYSSDQELSAVIVEVHNISQERRPFLLYNGSPLTPSSSHDTQPQTTSRLKLDSRVIYTHPKDFHSSEFNGRDGTYTPNTVDPMYAQRNGKGSLDASITMTSKEGRVMVVARMKSQGKPLESEKLGVLEKLSLFCFCCHAALMPFPHMIYQYLRLHFRLKLKVFNRPTPNRYTIARPSTRPEIFLETVFRKFIKSKVRTSTKAIRLRYIAPEETRPSPNREEVFVSPSAEQGDVTTQETELRILTPAFFSRIVLYKSSREALKGEIFNIPEENRTAMIENPQVINELLDEGDLGEGACEGSRKSTVQSLVLALRQPLANATAQSSRTRFRGASASDLDVFALDECNSDNANQYVRVLSMLFITQRLRSMGALWSIMFAGALGILLARTASPEHGVSLRSYTDVFLMAVTMGFGCAFVVSADWPAF